MYRFIWICLLLLALMSLVLSIDADLSAPPSSPSVFRDVLLQASIRGYENVARCSEDSYLCYSQWFRTYGLWDYLEELLPDTVVINAAVIIEGGPAARLTAHNLNEVLNHIPWAIHRG